MCRVILHINIRTCRYFKLRFPQTLAPTALLSYFDTSILTVYEEKQVDFAPIEYLAFTHGIRAYKLNISLTIVQAQDLFPCRHRACYQIRYLDGASSTSASWAEGSEGSRPPSRSVEQATRRQYSNAQTTSAKLGHQYRVRQMARDSYMNGMWILLLATMWCYAS